MKREESQSQYIRTIYKTSQYEAFYNALPARVQAKFDFVLNVVTTIYNVPIKFVKHLDNTNLYEMRVSIGTNEYRTILFALDKANFIEAKYIILLNGFLKKDKSDYKKQIDAATIILNNLEL